MASQQTTRFRSRCVGFALLLAAGPPACGGYESPQKEWSAITPEQRAQIRSIVQNITGGSPRAISALALSQVIIEEGQRVFSDPNADSIVVSGRTLDLTSTQVLPEFDRVGQYDPTGGFQQFSEQAFDDDGEETRDEKVRRPLRQFTAGSLSSFDYRVTTDTPRDLFVVTTQDSAFEVGAEVSYTTSIWRQVQTSQRINTGVEHNQTFSYQPQTTLNATLRKDGRIANTALADDTIISERGFDVRSRTLQDVDLEGTYTRYRPVQVPPNTRAEADLETSTDSTGGFTTVQTSVTERSEETTNVGPLEQTKVTTASVITSRVTDDAEGNRQVSSERVTHTTEVVQFEVKNTSAPDLDRRRDENPDHVITVRETVRETNSYDQGGSFTVTTVTLHERYTDNPVTRNDVAEWLTTERTTVRSFDAASGRTTTTQSGTKWLTDRIEVDSEISGVEWAMAGQVDVEENSSTRFFGDDREGIETKSVQTRDYRIKYRWGSGEVEVSGTIVNRRSSITPPRGTPHPIEGDWDGTLDVKLGETTFEVSAEEWLSSVQP